ncbi:hypothetical protein AAFF_G00374820 [Aldrovandia affinis]|uniref:Fibronectin type-III domain-containing protein n=1 Tax=Aldrovandia affinis TaxID=143900 RepID=A0AAD7SI66_9TELE|nr:hypothetical protein AAFF_G00374820 [Aldrovandia affinis]
MDISQSALLLLSWACMVCASNNDEYCCGKIYPDSPVLELDREFTATCVLSTRGKQETHATADDIDWMFKNYLVPKEYYTRINDSAVSMTVNITRKLESPLKCYVSMPHGLPSRIVHGMFFTVGHAPEKPENVSCIVAQSGEDLSPIMKCSWSPGSRDPILPTNYTLCGYVGLTNQICNSSSERHIGLLDFNTMPVYLSVEIWVEAKNQLRTVKSDVLTVYPEEIVKTNPPRDIEVVSEKGFPTSLLVRWNHSITWPDFELQYNIRFCAAGAHVWSEVPPNDTVGYINSFRLQYLKIYADYIVQVRCIMDTGLGYWSDWSQNVTGKTSEAIPSSRPELWRVIISPEGSHEKLVKLMWKEPIRPNGRILEYNLTIQKDGKLESFQLSSSHKAEYILEKVKSRVDVQITARNSVGVSPPSHLIVSGSYREPSPVMTVKWLTQNGSLWVLWEWTLPNPREFVLEWVSVSDGFMDWQTEPGYARNASLKGNLQPFKRYNVSVYPVVRGRPEKPQTVAAYLQQGPPSEGPSVKVTRHGKTEVELEWEPPPVDSLNGCITKYTVFYKTGGIDLPPSVTSHTLKQLSSDSEYVVHVMVSTVAGSINGSDLTFKTLKYASGEIEGIVVIVCIAFLFVTVLMVLCCIKKKEMIKKHIWPQVPDPSNSTIANWSPEFPSRPDTPKEGSLTDVSVVEVDVFEKKSLGEEDKTSLPLKKDKYLSEEHSSGIGGSSCMSSPRQSVSDSDEGDSGQTTASTVQYSSVVASGYKGQTPAPLPPTFARSESTQPLLESEDHHDDPHGCDAQRYPRNPYFRRPRTVNEGGVPPLMLHQIEIAEQSSSSLGFSAVEEGPQQATPSTEAGLSEGPAGSAPSYMPQQSGYRPQ